MKIVTRLFFLVFGVFLMTQPAFGQNDCTTPFVIPGIPFSSGTQTTCGTVNDFAAGFAPCVSSSYGGGEDYVYSLTVTGAPVTYQFSLAGAATWKILALHSACPPNSGNCLAGTTTSSGTTGMFNYTFTTNATYYLIVDTWPSPNCGEFTLNIAPPPPPPSNDECSGAIAFPTIPSNGTCATVTANTANATGSPDPTCIGTEDDDIWYTFTVPVGFTSLNYTNTNISGNTDRVHQIFSGSCPGTSIGCYDPESGLITGLVGGQTYLLRTYTSGTGVNSNYTICLSTPPPPPANDECVNAIPFPTIPSNGTCASVTANTQGATGVADATCTGTEDDDIWYTFTVPVGFTSLNYLNTSIGGTSSDRVLQILSGSCPGVNISCHDPESGTISGLVGGQTYLLRAYTWGTGVHSNFTICLSTPPPPPSNDECVNAIPFPAIPLNGTCAIVTANTQGATGVADATCTGTEDDDIWYSFTVPVGYTSVQYVNTSIGGSSSDRVHQILSGSCPGTNVGCYDPESGTFTGLVGGQTYLLRTYTWSSGVHSNYTICLRIVPPAPANDLCANAIPITCGSTTMGSTISATTDVAPTCNSVAVSQPGVWYTLVGNGGNATLSLCGTSFDTRLSVYTGSCGTFTCVTANDNFCSLQSEVTFPTTNGTTYYVLVHQATTTNGLFTLTATCTPPVVLTCPQNTTTAACLTQAEVNSQFTAWLATASGTGGCNGVLTNNNTGAPSACGGSTTVTFTYTSTCAPLTSTCQATFTVPSAPTVVLTCPVNMTTGACQTQADVNSAYNAWLATASASGGCNGVLTNNSTGAPSACGGSVTVTFTYTSSCAPTTTTCQATFTVTNPPPVVLTCPNNANTPAGQSQAEVDAIFAAWLATASGSGGCNGVLTNDNTGAPSATDGGSTTVTFTYTSSCAPMTTTCQATFTVTTGPVITLNCPMNTTTPACQTQAAVDAAFDAWLATANASGGCNGVLTNNNMGAPPACGGSTTVTFTYTSTCAPLTTTCTATFTVASSPVVLTCPMNMTTTACQTQAAVNTAFANWLATASASGGCNGVLTNNNTGAPSACGGSTTVTFTYTSSCAPTTSTCTATFTVPAPPTVVLTCPVNTTVSACMTQAALDAAYNAWLASATASGGCNGVLTNNSPGAPLICSPTAVVRTVTFTYTSSCSPMTTTCTATFTVPAYPAYTVPANGAATVACPALATQPTPPTVVDGCGKPLTPTGPVITNNPNPLTCQGTRTYTWTYTDCSGSVKTWSFTYTVVRLPFNVPANTASEVACPALIVQPTPPAVQSNCGETITPTGPVIVNNPNPITCEGTRTFTWTYTDCAGNVRTWSHVTTVERQPFGVPANGGTTVACPDQTDTQPTAPVVLSNCGEVLTPVVTSTAKPGCEGNRNWNFTYTDCEGNTATWVFVYTVEYLDFVVPASETLTVECPLNASQPTAPVVKDNCGKTLNPTGPVITSTNNASGCENSRKYTWTYQDCEGNVKTWSKTFNFAYTADFFVYPDGEEFVGCLLYAFPPIPPTIYDNCGNEIKVTGPTITGNLSNCSGTRTYTFIYTDCGGHSHPWKYTYHAADNEPPVGTCGGGTMNSVNVTNLACIEDVPCPGNYDFTSKIEELIAAGNIYDVCSGDDINVELDSWSFLWQCNDDDGDGVYTFGRTFYFRISDQCGNEMPSLCGVTYSGVCQPISTYTQGDWGNEGGEPGSSTPTGATDLATITTLLSQGPLTIGGPQRSLTLTSAQCVLNLVPGVGNPTILGNCIQTNCNGCNPAGPIGMKNTLATNTIALMLNTRYNVQYNGLTMANVRNQSLNCINIDANIKFCSEPGGCKLRVFETNGTVHQFPYTIGGLIDLANLYLNGGLVLTSGSSSVYANAINNSITKVNQYWYDGNSPTTCDPSAGHSIAPEDNSANKVLPTGNTKVTSKDAFSLSPNPAGSEVTFKLAEMTETSKVTCEIYNSLGKSVLRQDFGMVNYLNERVDLGGISSGLYIVVLKAGDQRFEQKLVISKD